MQTIENYQKQTYKNEVNSLLIEFLNKYKVKSAIDLGCGSGNESVYMIKKGIKVLSIDKVLNEKYILDRLSTDEKKRVSFIQDNFENIVLPKTDLIVALFSIPFCKPNKFNELWDNIYDSINDGGFFVGQLFGDRGIWNPSLNVNTFSKDKITEYLKKIQNNKT